MATRYFKNSVDQYWHTNGNWWANAACDEGFAGTLTGVNVTDTDTEVTCDNTFGLAVGRPITGDGIDTGTTVASITNSTTFELSQAAISTETSNLSCELHVSPTTGDDVVIATGNGTIAGSPNADVFGLVTVNGDTVLDLSDDINAANIEFNDTSSITDGGLTGTCVFNDSSFASIPYPSLITGNCTFNDSSYISGTIIGDCTFNNTSGNGGGGGSGYITGSCTFNDTSVNFSGDIYGTVTFNDSSYNNQYGSINGTAIFNDSSYNNTTYGTITGDCTFNNYSNNYGTITGDCTFNNYSSNTTYGTITGNCTFSYFSYNYGNITGNCNFNDSSYNDFNITGNCNFNDYSYNNTSYGTITGNCNFSYFSYNYGNITGNCNFNDSSYNNGNITGNCNFNDSSYNNGYGTITGNATFPEAEYSSALQGGNYGGNGPQQGTVTGTVTFTSLTPVKFTLAGTETWQVNTTGWVFDTAGQNWEFNDESCNGSYGTVNGACVFNGGQSYAIPYQNQGTVNGNCVFNVYNGLDTAAVVNGDCVFNSTRVAGTITGNCTFNDGSWCNWECIIIGNCTFSYSASLYLDGTVTGDCEFNGNSYNYADITGNASFTNTAFSTATTSSFNPQQGTVSGTVDFPNGATFTLANNEAWTVDASVWTGTLAWVFTSNSYPDVSITGNATFYDDSYNTANTITGNAIIRQHAAAFTAWRDYATSTYITGTLTLQFPEMDILGTGLL